MVAVTSEDDPLVREIRGLREDVRHLAETNRWRRIGKVALGVGVALALVLGLSNIALYVEVSRTSAKASAEATCVRVWAVQYTARAELLLDSSQQRGASLDTLARSFLAEKTTPKERSEIAEAYLDKSNAYNQALAANPIPAAPKFDC